MRRTTFSRSSLSPISEDIESGRIRRKRIRRRPKKTRLFLVPLFSFLILIVMLIGTSLHLFDSKPGVSLSKKSASLHLNPYYPEFKQYNVHLSDEIVTMCTKTLWHTLATTTIVLPENETFVHTGDIDDLWLRDSAAQIHTLLLPYGNQGSLVQRDAKVRRVVSGLIKRTAFYIRHDPYANAFRIDTSYKFSEAQKALGRHDYISTWNYELDSNCYFLRMLYFYWKQVPDDPILRLQSVHDAVRITVDLWKAEQQHEKDAYPTGPLFDCLNCNKPYRYKELPRDGKGTETNPNAGLTWTGFRPSDDACKYYYNIPSNMFAAVALEYAAFLAIEIWDDSRLAQDAKRLQAEIQKGIEKYGIVDHPDHGKIYAYEVDGLGNANMMDDANVPSLLSIPYLGYAYDPDIYANTRNFVLSEDNRYYRKSNDGKIEGIGSPHTVKQIRNGIWPMSVAMRGLTSESLDERMNALRTLAETTGDTGWMHESIDVENPKKYTRWWFCWVDSLFAELVMSLSPQCPDASYEYKILEWRDPITVE